MYTIETFQLSNRPDIKYTEIAGISLLGLIGITALVGSQRRNFVSISPQRKSYLNQSYKLSENSEGKLEDLTQSQNFVSISPQSNSYLFKSAKKFFNNARGKNGDLTDLQADQLEEIGNLVIANKDAKFTNEIGKDLETKFNNASEAFDALKNSPDIMDKALTELLTALKASLNITEAV